VLSSGKLQVPVLENAQVPSRCQRKTTKRHSFDALALQRERILRAVTLRELCSFDLTASLATDVHHQAIRLLRWLLSLSPTESLEFIDIGDAGSLLFFLWRVAELGWLCVRIVWIAATKGMIELNPGVPGLIMAGGRICRQAKPYQSMILELMRGISCSVTPWSISRFPVAARQASPLQDGTMSGPSRSIPLPLPSASTSQ
jgi:hypothetical protein